MAQSSGESGWLLFFKLVGWLFMAALLLAALLVCLIAVTTIFSGGFLFGAVKSGWLGGRDFWRELIRDQDEIPASSKPT